MAKASTTDLEDAAPGTTTDTATDTATDAAAPSDLEATPAATSDDDGSGSVWATLMAAAALVVSLLTAFVVWRRGRPAPADPGERNLEDTRA